jgi:outer membrane protein assembly factor BamB
VRKALVAAALVLLLALGAVVGYVLYKRHEARNIRGSSSQEFVTTETTPPVERTPAVVWPTYGYDNERVKAVTGFHLRPPFKEQWAFRARKLLEFPPVIAYGKLYIANNAGVVFAIEARTGHEKWSYDAKRCTAASPAVANRLLYQVFLNRPPCNSQSSNVDGEIVAFHAIGGKVRWRRSIGPSETSPLVSNGLVYVGDWRGKVYAFDAGTGKLRWTFTTGG